MSPARKIGFALGWVVTAFFFALGVMLWLAGARMNREFWDAEKAVLASFPIDLSVPGTYEGPFTYTYNYAHTGWVYIEVAPGPAEPNILEGLRLAADVVDTRGGVEEGEVYSSEDMQWQRSRHPDSLKVSRVRPYAVVAERLRVRVLEPAPRLAGKTQRLFVRYELCGLERMPMVFTRVLSLMSFATGLGSGMLMLWLHLRSRARHGAI